MVELTQEQFDDIQNRLADLELFKTHKHTGVESLQLDSTSGVISIAAGFGISASASTGAVTIANTMTDQTIPTTDNTTSNVSISKHGWAPKAPNDATKFLDGTGAYSTPSGSSFSTASGTDSSGLLSTPINTTHTVTHGLGKRPIITNITVQSLQSPVPAGAGSNWNEQSGWLHLDTNGAALGGIIIQDLNTTGAYQGFIIGPTSITGTGATSGGTGTATITFNNFTNTTFDIVYTGSVSAGPSRTYTFPTVNWTVIG